MRKRWKWLAVGAVLALAVGGGWVARAADTQAALAARLAKSGAILPLEQILQRAQAAQPGKVIEAEFEQRFGRYVYDVEVLDDKGIVWKLRLDAKTGAVMRVKQEDD